jgi:hypothetical protein
VAPLCRLCIELGGDVGEVAPERGVGQAEAAGEGEHGRLAAGGGGLFAELGQGREDLVAAGDLAPCHGVSW